MCGREDQMSAKTKAKEAAQEDEAALPEKQCQSNTAPRRREPTVQYRMVRGEAFYAVGDDGSVLSWKRERGRIETHSARSLKPYKDSDGYLLVELSSKTRKVHRLVMEAFVGPLPPGQ